ncbi:hypothetical protein [Deinococcus multiflagellatus]|uniref:Uncharacterized protein n=1 Tax=Deinococcus multiflagellatus TaxID=1656887 RepID=A0ABW1ZM39_9DEIO|nr:hypothetical protein [Deinococcus multiflagellatus]MBZ9713897.1 hypothetical protein [Deinococcus multiflagellatus]
MQLQNGGGLHLSLEIVDYQFPEATDEWDANWLNVRLHLHLPDGRTWDVIDPCLTAQEAQRLGTWLKEVAEYAPTFIGWQGTVLSSEESFTEPCLMIAARSPWFRHPERDDHLHLRVTLSSEYLPPFAHELDHSPAWSETGEILECWLDFPLTEEGLRKLIAQWEAQISQFPVRPTP